MNIRTTSAIAVAAASTIHDDFNAIMSEKG